MQCSSYIWRIRHGNRAFYCTAYASLLPWQLKIGRHAWASVKKGLLRRRKILFFFFYCVIFLYLTATKAGLIFCSKTNLNIQIFLLLYSMKFIHKISGSPFDVIYDIISCFDSNNSIFNSLKNIVKCQIALTAKYIRFWNQILSLISRFKIYCYPENHFLGNSKFGLDLI